VKIPYSDSILASNITHAASKQTYATIRYLVDPGRVDDAYRAYAYFRWVDDWLDNETHPRSDCLAFVNRQQELIESAYRGGVLASLTPEEMLLVDLVGRDTENNSGLQAYIRNMMAVMAFDAERRGRFISQQELNQYTHWLAVAVTECMHHFIGHGANAPHDEARYLAVTGAHITHMLRDAVDDAAAGYYNIPREILLTHGITPWDIRSQPYRTWVKTCVQDARACFQAGKKHLAQVENWRCRMTGYAYTYRFEIVLDLIERDNYLLRAEYPERKGYQRSAQMLLNAFWMALNSQSAAHINPAMQAQ
jgi:phytoene/squalene synthetase